MEPNKLTLKQRLWLKHYLETGNATEAARRAGYQCDNEGSLRVIGHENLTKLNTSEFMEEMGITKVALIKMLMLGLTKPVKYILKRVIKTRDDGSTVHLIEQMVVPDYETRHKYFELALKLQRML